MSIFSINPAAFLINTDELYSAKKRLDSAIDTSSQVRVELEKNLKEVASNWSGVFAEEYTKRLSCSISKSKLTIQSLEMLSEDIQTICEKLEEINSLMKSGSL